MAPRPRIIAEEMNAEVTSGELKTLGIKSDS